MNLIPHHLGCAVKTLESGLLTYSETLMLGRRTNAFDIASQSVSVCFIELQKGFYLELVAPHATQTRLANYLRAGFYHLCFLTDDLSGAQTHLKGKGFAALPAFASEAFAGELCQFFVSPELHLIELAQMPPNRFEEFIAGSLTGESVRVPSPGPCS